MALQKSHSLHELLNEAVQQLLGSDTGQLDAEILLAMALARPRSWLYAWPEYIPPAAQINTFQALLEKRRAGWPIAYLAGEKEFWSMNFKVDINTLIPRPETETLLDVALGLIHQYGEPEILELGTGSGILAISILAMRPHSHMTATDISCAALQVAAANAKRHKMHRIRFVASNWFSGLQTVRYNLIISNPPYLSAADIHWQAPELHFEPHISLCAGETGLEALQELITQAGAYLTPGGHLLLEHGYEQANDVRAIFKQHGYYGIHTVTDAAGHERVTGAQYG